MSKYQPETPRDELRRITSNPERPVNGLEEAINDTNIPKEAPPQRPSNPLALTLREVDGRLELDPDASSLAPACVLNLRLSPRPICDHEHEHPVSQLPVILEALDESSSSRSTASDDHARPESEKTKASSAPDIASGDSHTLATKDQDEGLSEDNIHGCSAMDIFNA